ncbi:MULTISPECIES: 2-C-methyl-D-erythritol 4-phosphate cytidylyltransferase [Clostridium]|uniref:2-C-methyl-D-erythritol 4-phosphate cytidylyltransferase n=2 Tax=Clostridium TaxID=1485 RepID=A0A151AMD3_9CLOT|nr:MULTISPECIES: 2-C-methyl-D-erythritol 4-phosphate cytidylyltransferase [Clostridium]KYH28789.1 putative ribitol-5-phosphate cytidylyltransferase [Clostridium colicanis DSM 13634]MBE6043348.1 2-C-methyl-D-erythritol 4-phosphate cytidylyltransferase [Clostridium thermopalmarium]PRR76152.1 2-C-methyl-D-erythritol 4-phosphate cytidylyltransferase 1 [Clostridium thermopalmarium DSM 5974]PVZ21395.1 2-C-methyl-D-erythritol 4-phosphate cytidylyltransferase [Clostridium thermopalmarium DSM 5974]
MGRNCAIIVAAGKGTRMKAKINKQFIKLKGKPILYYTLKAFEDNDLIDEIVLVLAKNEIEYCKDNILNKYKMNKIKKIVEGGSTRQDSVIRGLLAAKGNDVVLIHDGARPFVDNRIIEDGIKYANIYDACACGVEPKDTIKIKTEDGFSLNTPKRETLFSVQTPQCFKYDLILDAHKKALKEKIEATDDTMIVENYNHKVYLYEGSYNNIKITTPEDLIIGERILDMM